MLLVWLQGGVTAAAPTAPQTSFATVVRRAGLTAAVVATLQPIWPPSAPVAAAAQYGVWTQTDRYNPAQRSVELLSGFDWTAQVPPPFFQTYQEGWRSQFSQPAAYLKSRPRLQGFTAYAAEVPNTEYQEGWRNLWQAPPAYLQPRRATNLLESWGWPGYGYSFQAVVQTPTGLWWPRWQEPPHRLKAPPRLEGFVASPGIGYTSAAPTQYNYGLHNERHLYSPAKRSVDLLGQVAWPGIGYSTAVVVAPPSEWWSTRWTDAPAYNVPRRSVGLLGQAAWDPPQQAAPTQYNYGLHNERHLYSPAKRSVDLLGQVAWPGIGYSTAVVVAPPSEWWSTRWQDPPQAQRPRQEGFVAWPGLGYSFVAVVTYQEGWRSPFTQPLKVFQPPRQQGFVSFAGVSGLPVTLSPGAWSPQPAAWWARQRNWRIAGSWPWQAYSFTIPAATPSALWFPVWQERPKERQRSIYLRQGSWAGWDPQFIIQITPPTPLEGITFTFGLKRGASATPGVKEGATMTGQRKTGGATLITRVKPRNS